MDDIISTKHNFSVAKHAVCLPVELINAVKNLGLSTIRTNNCLHFLDLIVGKLLIKKLQPDRYSSMGAKFLRSQFNSRYKEWLDKLLENGVVESDNDYAKYRSKSLGYRVNPLIVSNWSDLQVVVLSNVDAYEPLESDKPYFNGLLDFLDSIEINYSILSKIIDEELPIVDKGLNFKRYSWYRSIRLLQSGIIRAAKSPVNNRLNTNFTNMPSVLIKCIMKSNDLIEIDAMNSQFAILANMIKEKVNDDFITDAICGVLYEKLAEKLGCSRDEAKGFVMKTIYSKHYHNNKTKKIMSELYPESMNIIEKYKRKSSNRELAIAMQQKESEIYIDGVLRKLYYIGIHAFSKHDSIIFHRKDLKVVESVIRETLADMNFQLKLKVSNS